MAQDSTGFDMSKLSTASKILLGGGILLLIDSFLGWQKNASMWSGSGSIFGIIGGLLTIVLLIWEALALVDVEVSLGMPASKVSAYLGLGVFFFVLLRFGFAVANSPAFGAFLGLILALAIGYGAWMRFQEPESPGMPPSPPQTPGMTG